MSIFKCSKSGQKTGTKNISRFSYFYQFCSYLKINFFFINFIYFSIIYPSFWMNQLKSLERLARVQNWGLFKKKKNPSETFGTIFSRMETTWSRFGPRTLITIFGENRKSIVTHTHTHTNSLYILLSFRVTNSPIIPCLLPCPFPRQ